MISQEAGTILQSWEFVRISHKNLQMRLYEFASLNRILISESTITSSH